MRFLISFCVSLLLLINVAFSSVSVDPCSSYESLDRPWRATNESGLWICDDFFSWNGWYRFFYNGMDIRMPESCVSAHSCNSEISLSLNASHPQIEDGVVIMEICGASFWNGCCDEGFSPIRVKACPGDYYVYELVNPQYGCSAYCTDISTISQKASTASPAVITESSLTMFSASAINTDYDPCYNYNILDNYWRNTLNYLYMNGYISGYDDARVEWHGWYRLFINGSSAQMPEWCFSSMSCGGFSSLWLGGSHPQLEDGVVSRDVYGSYYDQCRHYRSDPIQVKACPSNYYVYKLIKPKPSIPLPVYCAVAISTPNTDPCYSYTSLDEPWRATDNSYISNMCDYNVNWNGWYRLFYNGQSVQMPESCVNSGMCGTYHPMWLSGPHPQLEDGVVTRQVCSSSWGDCCGYRSHPIQVKACPGNYYVYEFVMPLLCASYCADVTSLNAPTSTTTVAILPIQSTTEPVSDTAFPFDPCYGYTVLDNPWRATDNRYTFNLMCDAYVSWVGWYRLFIQGQSVQMPDTCVDRLSCGTHAPLWLDGPHPQIEDGVVTRGVCGHWFNDCCFFQSSPINVKACPGNYYVYEFVRPTFCYGTYCADVRNISINNPTVTPETSLTEAVRIDPCNNYTALDDPWRATNNHYSYNCDANVNFVGWYRLFIESQNAQMPETCVDLFSCGTVAPLWLNGQHPRVGDGVVSRHVCGHWENDCCNFEFTPMKVKACPGNYYVYEFINPVICFVAYCADIVRNNTINYTTVTPQTSSTDPCSELNCTEDERCETKHGVYGCFCKDNHNRSQHDSFDFSETCESSSGSMSLSRCQLFEAGFPPDILHLNDPSCRGTVRNGRVEFYFDNNDHICGTSLMANGTHFIYENFIVGEPDTVGYLIGRERILKLHFSCVYSQTQTLSMDINPLESIVHRILPAGQGTYQVRMIPYQDAEFSWPFTGSVNVELSKRIFVEVRVDGVDSRQFASVIDTCWATPVNDPHYSLRWDLIKDMCPNPDDNTVDLLQNGVSTSSRFSFEMFIFTANSTKVYLHCAIHLCLQTDNHCSVHCDSEHHHREGRSVHFHDSASISMGPLMWSNSNKDMQVPRQVQVSRAPWLCGSLTISLISLMSVLIFF